MCVCVLYANGIFTNTSNLCLCMCNVLGLSLHAGLRSTGLGISTELSTGSDVGDLDDHVNESDDDDDGNDDDDDDDGVLFGE